MKASSGSGLERTSIQLTAVSSAELAFLAHVTIIRTQLNLFKGKIRGFHF
jgi:hypothetical protein